MSNLPHGRRGPDDDPTEMLRTWREQQREERLADTREFPELLDTRPAATRPAPRRRRVPLVLAGGVGALVALGAVAVASAVDRPSSPTVVSPATTPAPPSSGGSGNGSGNGSDNGSGNGSGGSAATAVPSAPDDDATPPAGGDDGAGPPAPPDGGPGDQRGGGPGAGGPGSDGGPGAGGGAAGGDAPAPPGR